MKFAYSRWFLFTSSCDSSLPSASSKLCCRFRSDLSSSISVFDFEGPPFFLELLPTCLDQAARPWPLTKPPSPLGLDGDGVLAATAPEDTEDEDNSTTIPAKVPNKKRRRQRQQQRQHKRVMRRLFVDELYPGASSSSNKLSNQQSRHHDDYIDLSSIRVDLFK